MYLAVIRTHTVYINDIIFIKSEILGISKATAKNTINEIIKNLLPGRRFCGGERAAICGVSEGEIWGAGRIR